MTQQLTRAEKIGEAEGRVQSALVDLAVAAGLGKHYADELMEKVMDSVTESLMNEGIDPFAEEE